MTAEQVNQKIQQQIEQVAAPVRELQSTLLGHAEKLARFQLEMAQSYTEMALSNVREVSTVNSVEGIQNYLENYPRTLQRAGEKIAQDGRTLAQLGQDVGADLQRIARENVTAVNKSAA